MSGFPLLLIPLAICNIIVFLMPGVSFDAPLFTLPLISGASWTVTLSVALIAFGLLLLMLEMLRSARTGGKYVTDHLLALLLFGGAAAEFLMLPQFANATFFLLTVIALVDFLSGLGLRARRPKRLREAAVEPVVEPPPVLRETPAVVAPVVVPHEPIQTPVETVHVDPPAPATQPVRVEPIIDTVLFDETHQKPRLPPRDAV